MGSNGHAHNGIPAQELRGERFRRAVDGALISHTQTLDRMDVEAKQSRAFAADMSGRLDEYVSVIMRLQHELATVRLEHAQFVTLPFGARLKWLFSGSL